MGVMNHSYHWPTYRGVDSSLPGPKVTAIHDSYFSTPYSTSKLCRQWRVRETTKFMRCVQGVSQGLLHTRPIGRQTDRQPLHTIAKTAAATAPSTIDPPPPPSIENPPLIALALFTCREACRSSGGFCKNQF